MPKPERIRECVSGLPTQEYFSERVQAGWNLVALEWEGGPPREDSDSSRLHEVPYGFRIAPDCVHLEDEPEEKRALTVMMEIIVQDRPLSHVASELNRRGFHTRQKSPWTPVDVFKLLPRLVETGPSIFASPDWVALRRR